MWQLACYLTWEWCFEFKVMKNSCKLGTDLYNIFVKYWENNLYWFQFTKYFVLFLKFIFYTYSGRTEFSWSAECYVLSYNYIHKESFLLIFVFELIFVCIVWSHHGFWFEVFPWIFQRFFGYIAIKTHIEVTTDFLIL